MGNSGKKILILYKSRFGYIKEIVEKIAETLNEVGLNTQLVNMDKARRETLPSIIDFDGVLMGHYTYPLSMIKGRKAHVWINHLFRDYQAKLKNRKNIIGTFISSPFEFPFNPELVEKYEYNKKDVKVMIDITTYFGPVIDFSRTSKLNKREKETIRDFAKKLSKKDKLEFDLKGKNDFRDWDRIERFGRRFAELVMEEKIEEKAVQGKYCKFCGYKINNPEAKFCLNCGVQINE